MERKLENAKKKVYLKYGDSCAVWDITSVHIVLIHMCEVPELTLHLNPLLSEYWGREGAGGCKHNFDNS